MSTRVTVVGRGRAGGAFHRALRGAGWEVDLLPHDRAGDLRPGSGGLVLLCVPDSAVGAVSGEIAPSEGHVVAHCSGALGLDVLAGHPRRASLHPLVALPDPERGAGSLRGAWFATAGDPLVEEVVDALDGRRVEVTDAGRVRYHAAAVVASNHLVALFGQVQRVAESVGVPLEAFLDLARGSLDDVSALGPARALTGPVARGDWATVASHLEALPEAERPAYLAMAQAAARLVGGTLPEALGG